jgi:hypothetical protein
MLVQAGGVSQSLPVVWRTLCCNSVEGEAGFAKHCTPLVTLANGKRPYISHVSH